MKWISYNKQKIAEKEKNRKIFCITFYFIPFCNLDSNPPQKYFRLVFCSLSGLIFSVNLNCPQGHAMVRTVRFILMKIKQISNNIASFSSLNEWIYFLSHVPSTFLNGADKSFIPGFRCWKSVSLFMIPCNEVDKWAYKYSSKAKPSCIHISPGLFVISIWKFFILLNPCVLNSWTETVIRSLSSSRPHRNTIIM